MPIELVACACRFYEEHLHNKNNFFIESSRNSYVDRQANSAGACCYFPIGSVFVMPGCNFYIFEGHEGPSPPAYVDIR